MTVEDRLTQLGISLPPPPHAVAKYVPVVIAGGLAFVSGQIPIEGLKPLAVGRVGADIDAAAAADLARRCVLQALAALRAELGNLDQIRRIVKMTVLIASTEDFTQQPIVANGASQVLLDIFGESGQHARVALSAMALPMGVPIELELIVALI